MWSREASSGTTPPYTACRSTWLYNRCASSPASASTIAMPVSSQEVSIPSTRMFNRHRSDGFGLEKGDFHHEDHEDREEGRF